MDTAWYLIQTKSRSELIAKDNLENQGFVTYLPMLDVRRRTRGKSILRREALFPSYVFILLYTINDNWSPIRSTRGVLKLVRFGAEFGRVPEALIEALKKSERKSQSSVSMLDFNSGDRVRVAVGPLAGYEGIFESKNSEKRAVILLELVGKYTEVCVNLSDVDKV